MIYQPVAVAFRVEPVRVLVEAVVLVNHHEEDPDAGGDGQSLVVTPELQGDTHGGGLEVELQGADTCGAVSPLYGLCSPSPCKKCQFVTWLST